MARDKSKQKQIAELRSKLTPAQRKCADIETDPNWDGTVCDLCEQIGVARSTYYAWLNHDEDYIAYREMMLRGFSDAILPKAWRALSMRCEAGDVSALRLFFELVGKSQTAGTVVINIHDDL